LVFAIQQNDILIIQAITAVLVAGVVIFNLVVDLLYAVVDPRIRHARQLG
jgi:peptide/nickel transport system permease protein